MDLPKEVHGDLTYHPLQMVDGDVTNQIGEIKIK